LKYSSVDTTLSILNSISSVSVSFPVSSPVPVLVPVSIPISVPVLVPISAPVPVPVSAVELYAFDFVTCGQFYKSFKTESTYQETEIFWQMVKLYEESAYNLFVCKFFVCCPF